MIKILLLGVIAYFLFCTFFFFFKWKLIFFPRKGNPFYSHPWRENRVSIKRDNVSIDGWFLRKDVSPVVLYLGGNAEDVSLHLEQADKFPASLYLVNYPGYNGHDGKPSEKAIFRSALATYDYLTNEQNVSPDSIYLMGRSIGSPVAAYVAKNRKVKGLILVTPFDKLSNVAKRVFFSYPFLWVIRHHLDTVQYLKDVDAKTLVIVAGRDEVVPPSSTENLVKFLEGRGALIITFPKADHQNVSDFDSYQTLISDFVADPTDKTL